jgi:hypothetical protein
LRRAAILGLLLAPLLALHLRYLPLRGPYSLDGSYYLQAARSVAEENRLLTSVSLYHEGLLPLPGPWFLYPVWPILLGVVAKATGLVAAANALPSALYVIDLVLFALVGRRMQRRLGGQTKDDSLDAGHLAALLVGLNFSFFMATAYPYTEGLAFALALASLLVLDRYDEWPLLRWAGGAGVLAGLSMLTRYQMVALPLAGALALLLVRAARRGLPVYAAAVVIVVTPWLLYGQSLMHLRAGIPYYDEWVHASGLTGNIVQVFHGLAVAFDPFSRASYFTTFGAAVLLVPLALFARPRVALLPLAMVFTGLLASPMLAHFESIRFDHWLFGERHGLIFLFAIVAALAYCAAASKGIRYASIALALLAIVPGTHAIVSTPTPPGHGPSRGETALIAWLSEHAPRAALLTTNAQILSVYTRNPLHWTDCNVTPAQTELMLHKLPIEYVIVYANERHCPFVQNLGDVLTQVATFDDDVVPVYLFHVTRKIAIRGAPSSRHTATGWNWRTLWNTTSLDQSCRKMNMT